MTDLDVVVKAPNLGVPAMECLVPGAARVSFDAVVAVRGERVDLRHALAGRAFLQVPPDTKAVRRLAETTGIPVLSTGTMGAYGDRLVPLRVESTGPARADAWWWFDEEYSHEQSLTFSASAQDLARHGLPRLFNLLVDYPSGPYLHVNPHAVYVRDRPWSQVRFLQATDLHVAGRNDEIPAVVAAVTGRAPTAYVNFNDSVRTLVRGCNALHRQGRLDFLVLTGDLVDYVSDNDSLRHPFGLDNVHYLRDLLTGEPTRTRARLADGRDMTVERPAVEELEVPVFTLLGNHDYRKNEYPLVHVPEVALPSELELAVEAIGAVFGIPFGAAWAEPVATAIVHAVRGATVEQFGRFGLTLEEAAAYTGGVPVISTDVGVRFVEYEERAPDPYPALFSPFSDHAVPLGRSVLVCLDTGHDEGVARDIYDVIEGLAGLDESTANFLESDPDSTAFTSAQVALVARAAARSPGAVVVACHSPVLSTDGLPDDDAREWRRTARGLPPWFAEGARDPDLGYGVADHEFEAMAAVLTDPDHGVDLVLSGHTHRDLELRLRRAGASFRYFYDSYLNGTAGAPEAPGADGPLDAAADPADWWRRHAPVTAQTRRLFPGSPTESTVARYVTIEDDVITSARTVRITDEGIPGPAGSAYAALGVSPP